MCMFIMMNLISVKVYADIGPKPSIVIEFNGFEGEKYYATLLANVESTGPYSVLKDGNRKYSYYQEGDEGYAVFLKFVEYKDEDGFYFLQNFQDCTESQQFSWTYYPPDEFKILLYFPEADRFVISEESYQRYAFDSFFEAEISGLNLLVTTQDSAKIILKKSYNYTDETLSLLIRFLLTFLLEIGVALLFGFREKKQICFIIFINLITQIGLNLTLNIINYRSGYMAFVICYILLEMLVFLVEAILYNLYLKKYSKKKFSNWKPWVYALIANMASFVIGLKLAKLIPGIF